MAEVSEFVRAVGRLFETADGKYVLEQLRAQTIEAPLYPRWNAKPKDVPPEFSGPRDETLFAPWRDGQNSVIRQIELWIFRSKQPDKKLADTR